MMSSGVGNDTKYTAGSEELEGGNLSLGWETSGYHTVCIDSG